MNIDPQAMSSSLRRLRDAPEDQDVLVAVQGSVDACVDLFGVTGSGLMIADEQNALRYAVASDGRGAVLETVQTRTGEGPCVDTFVLGEVVSTEDLAAEERWPASTPTLVQHGVRSVLGIPVRLGGVTVGSLDVYLDVPHRWDDSERRALTRYGAVVEAILAAALAARSAGELAGQLQYALDYRVVIERGVGYLMATERVDAVTAFNRLRRASRGSRRKIGEVAEELLATGSLPAADRS